MKGKIVGYGEKTRYYVDGKEVSTEEFEVAFPPIPLNLRGGGPCSLRGWARPIQSDALAVHPKQIKEVMERNRKHGLHIEYNQEDGRPILKDRGARRELMRIEGVHDKQGGYGDDHHTPAVKEEKVDLKHLDDI